MIEKSSITEVLLGSVSDDDDNGNDYGNGEDSDDFLDLLISSIYDEANNDAGIIDGYNDVVDYYSTDDGFDDGVSIYSDSNNDD